MYDGYHVLAIDGPSGIGKSSIIAPVVEHLHSRGVFATPFSNNESTPFSEAIRELAAGPHRPLSLALATAAARAFLLETNTNKLLVSDRHLLSTLVYQILDGVSLEYLEAINKPFIGSTYFILLEVSASTLSARRAERGRRPSDRFKDSLTPEREIELYREAAVILTSLGGKVDTILSEESSGDVAASVVEKYLLASGSNENDR